MNDRDVAMARAELADARKRLETAARSIETAEQILQEVAMRGEPGLRELVAKCLVAWDAVDAEAERAAKPGANAWSSAPVVALIKARDRLRAAVPPKQEGE